MTDLLKKEENQQRGIKQVVKKEEKKNSQDGHKFGMIRCELSATSTNGRMRALSCKHNDQGFKFTSH
jgi:hypothetical protein